MLVVGSIVLAVLIALFPRMTPGTQDYMVGATVVAGMIAAGWALAHEGVHLLRRVRRPAGPGREPTNVALTLAWLSVGLSPFAFAPGPAPFQVLFMFLALGVAIYAWLPGGSG